jgi:hypothetical protein
MPNITPLDRPYQRAHVGSAAGSCEAEANCLRPVEGTIKSKASGKTIRACKHHIEEVVAERRAEKQKALDAAASTAPPPKPSLASQIAACKTPVEVHKLIGDWLTLEGISKSSKRKLHRLAEKKIQSFKGNLIALT